MNNPYEDLGVDRKATKEEIKRVYRRKAQKAHPDKGGDKGEFQKLASAYALLEDDTRRHKYDTTGDTGDTGERQQMLADLAGLLLTIIDKVGDITRVNVVAEMTRILQDNISSNVQGKNLVVHAIAKREAALKRLNVEPGKENMLSGMITSDIAYRKTQIMQMDAAISKLVKLVAFIADYNYTVDAPPVRQAYEATLYTSSTSRSR